MRADGISLAACTRKWFQETGHSQWSAAIDALDREADGISRNRFGLASQACAIRLLVKRQESGHCEPGASFKRGQGNCYPAARRVVRYVE